jgi:hypothetical protein
MRTTVTIDDDVFEAVQAQARGSGKKLGEVLSQLARRGLRSASEAASTKGLPVFKIPGDATVIPSTRARDLLADDAT